MASYRFPILIWDHPADAGIVTACLVEGEANDAAVAPTRAAAVAQLKEMLQWRYRESPWGPKPNFNDPELTWVKVEVRPEYTSQDKIFPCRETVLLRVPCVRGKDSSGLLLCAMPTLGIEFRFDDDDSLAQLAAHYVQLQLKGRTPQELSAYLSPLAAELDDVVIQVPASAANREVPPDLRVLADVAEPLGARRGRGRLSRPWQRDEQVARLAQVLARERGSVLLLGESGAGKTAVLIEAVRKVEREPATESSASDVNEPPHTRVRNRFWLTNGSRLIAGMKYLGQWQARCEEVIAKLDEIGGVLCVEHLLDLVRIGGASAAESIASFLVPYLQRGELRLVGEATPAELDACRRLLPSFAALFTVIEIPAFSQRQAIDALSRLAETWGQNLKLACDRAVVEQIYRLFARFMPYQSFPGAAARFTMELFDRVSRARSAAVTDQAVIDRFTLLTGLPEILLRNDLVLEHERVVAALREKVIGQDAACQIAASVITTFKAGLNDPNRPVGVLLFCGPTGVGKTELARSMSEFLFGHGQRKDRLVRLDMSEYAHWGAVERLLGPPNGEPSELIRRLREQPFTVVLLDEIEKAAPEVFDLLLGVFDEGRLTDRFGRLTTFRSAIIVMTSNLGAERAEPFGLSHQPANTYDSDVAAFFRPEFFNRIDAIVTFDKLGQETIRQIATGELRRIATREGMRERKLRLEWTDEVAALLIQVGFDARYGARPLQRAVEQRVVIPLARWLVQHPSLRNTLVLLRVDASGNIVFDVP